VQNIQPIRIAVLVRANYWTVTPPSYFRSSGNGLTHRSVPDILQALTRAGAQPELVYQGSCATLDAFDGLLIPGGEDIHPQFYGQPVGPSVNAAALDPELDEFQLAWARQALELAKPALGICRGMQALNVAAGGTLIQDIPTTGTALDHAPSRALRNPLLRREAVHAMDTLEGSRLRQILGGEPVGVNSVHHQGVDTLGRGFQATGWAPDGIIEAIEGIAAPWQRGVQFHPEDMERFQPLFDSLVEDASLLR
jgi:putative glutamine amidotransferase